MGKFCAKNLSNKCQYVKKIINLCIDLHDLQRKRIFDFETIDFILI